MAVARGSRHFSLSFDESDIARLNNLASALEHYPNRLNTALAEAAHETRKEFKNKLKTNYQGDKGSHSIGSDDVIPITIKHNGRGISITASVLWANANPGAYKQSPTTRARFNANIKLRGRRRYSAKRSKAAGDDPYRVVSWNKGITHVYGFTVPAKSPNSSFVKFMTGAAMSIIFKKHLKQTLARQKIGPRGGISRISGGDNPV